MNELRTLLLLELRSLYGINKLRHTKDPKEKKRGGLIWGAWVILIAMVFFYVGGLVYGLCLLEMAAIVPAYLTVIASLLILATGLFTAGSRIFGNKGYDILASMPLRSENIVLSRFLSLYTEDLLLTLAVFIPGIATYGICQSPGSVFWLVAPVGILLIPAIPLVISTVLGSLILAISSRMKRKSLMQTLLTVLLVVGVLTGSFTVGNTAENIDLQALAKLAQTVNGLLQRLYPPAIWLGAAMAGDWGKLALFGALSLSVTVLTVWLVARNFHAIQRRLQSFTAKHSYQIGAMESRSLLKALYLRELRGYFSCTIYVTNTIVGPIMGAIMAVALCVTGLDDVQAALPVDVSSLLPFAFTAVFTMMTTSSVSISMEGKHFWVAKSLPIPTKTLLDSKILLNLTLMLPFYVISVIAMAIAVKPSLPELLWLALIPAVICLFVVVLGITVNLKFHSFDWEKPETVVKQSLSAALGGFAGFFTSILLAVPVLLLPQYADLCKAGACLLLLAVTVLLYRKNNRAVLCSL